MDKNKEKTRAMRERSGHVVIDSKLVSFLYDLMRDYLPLSDVEQLVRNAEDHSKITYTNGWLANYAKDLANDLVIILNETQSIQGRSDPGW